MNVLLLVLLLGSSNDSWFGKSRAKRSFVGSDKIQGMCSDGGERERKRERVGRRYCQERWDLQSHSRAAFQWALHVWAPLRPLVQHSHHNALGNWNTRLLVWWACVSTTPESRQEHKEEKTLHFITELVLCSRQSLPGQKPISNLCSAYMAPSKSVLSHWCTCTLQ